MIIYYIAFLMIVLFRYCCKRIKLKNKNYTYIILCFFVLISIGVLRKYTVGIDLEGHYARNFSIMSGESWQVISHMFENQYDIGFRFFNYLIALICSEEQFFIAITSVFTIGVVGYIFYKNTKTIEESFVCVFLFIVLFPYFMNLTAIAQSLAISLVLLGCEDLKRNRKWRFLACTFIATTIHASAACCIFLLPLQKLKFNKKSSYIALIITFVCYFNYKNLFRIFGYIIPTFNVYESITFHGEGSFGVGTILTVLSIAWIPFIGQIFLKKDNEISFQIDSKVIDLKMKSEYSYDFLMYCSIFCVAFRMLSIKMLVLGRMAHYFLIYAIIFVPRILNKIESKKNRQIIKIAIYFGGILYFIIFSSIWGQKSYGTFDYAFFWN